MTDNRTNSPVRVAINGAAGRMGRRLVALGTADSRLAVTAALERPDHPLLGQDAGVLAGIAPIGVALTSGLPGNVDAVIDFSIPASALDICEACIAQRVPLVLATTGVDEVTEKRIRAAAEVIPLVWAPNMSKAVNLTMELARVAAQAFRDDPGAVDVEILERHHRYKKDSPSGTALKFGQIIAEVMGQSRSCHGREGLVGERPRDEIGYHAIRVGDNPGEHTIVFGLLGETIELTVRASNRDCYALGALAAARFLAGKPAGAYSMLDVLGIASR